MDGLLPYWLTAEQFGLKSFPGFGLIVALIVVFVTGLLTANFIGKRLVGWAEAVLARIPIVRGIYSSVKQVSDTVLSPNGQAFREAVLIEFPRRGIWTIAFLTGTPSGETAAKLPQDLGEFVSVYVPTTPNPTGGYFVMLPKAEIVDLDMSVDQALKYIVSMGVVAPGTAP